MSGKSGDASAGLPFASTKLRTCDVVSTAPPPVGKGDSTLSSLKAYDELLLNYTELRLAYEAVLRERESSSPLPPSPTGTGGTPAAPAAPSCAPGPPRLSDAEAVTAAACAAHHAAYNSDIQQSCSQAYVTSYFACHSKFPSEGSWRDGQWAPSGCKLSGQQGARPLGSCLFDGTRKHIAILGDSHTMRYASAFERAMRSRGIAECARIQSDSDSDDYYGTGLVKTRRDCGGCDSFVYQCAPSGGGAPLLFSNTVLEFLIDFELAEPPRIHWDSTCDFSNALPCRWAWSTQQVLFDRFLPSMPGGWPDEVHLFANIHDCARRGPKEYARDLSWLLTLMNDTVPSTTRAFVWEAAALNSAKQPMNWARITSDTCVQFMNRAIHQALARFTRSEAQHAVLGTGEGPPPSAGMPGPQWGPTFGIFEASSQVAATMNYDGVHYDELW